MTITEELYQIKKIPYKVAGINEKMAMIESVIANEHPFTKWFDALTVFGDTKFSCLLAKTHVRHQIQYYANSSDVTFSFKADIAYTLLNCFRAFIDVHAIIKDVYGERYDAIVQQMKENEDRNNLFLRSVQGMNANLIIQKLVETIECSKA